MTLTRNAARRLHRWLEAVLAEDDCRRRAELLAELEQAADESKDPTS